METEMKEEMSRRQFVQAGSVLAAAAMAPNALLAGATAKPAQDKMVGIQVGANAFIDEGINQVLDTLQQRGQVNTLFISAFTFTNTIGGPLFGKDKLPGHGKLYLNYTGGAFFTPHPQFYTGTAVKDVKAPDHGDFDVLEKVIPEAKKRGLKVYPFIYGHSLRRAIPFMDKALEVNFDGKISNTGCEYNPDFKNLITGITRDLCTSYDIDGLMWGSEFQGPLNNVIAATPGEWKLSSPTCFCPFHRKAAEERGINVNRAIEGYRKLIDFSQKATAGQRPINGYFVEFWALLVDYPEIIAWEKLWTEGHHSTYANVYKTAKAVKPKVEVGFHIWHTNTFSPFARAEQNFERFAQNADFLKTVSYNMAGGKRYSTYIDNLGSTIFRDLPREETLKLNNYFMNYDGMPSLSELPQAGLPPDYVYRETKRALELLQGKCKIYPGIEINIPSNAAYKQTTPQGVYDATTAALKAGAQGILFSRNYSEMYLDNISGGGKAIKEFKI